MFSTIIMMALMILVGGFLSLRHSFREESRKLFVDIIVNVAMPSIILNMAFQANIDKKFMKLLVLIFTISIIINCLGILLGWISARMLKVNPLKVKEMALLSGLGNTGYIGIPLCATLFGPKGALLAAVFDAGLDFTIFTLGIMILDGKRKFSFYSIKELINPPLIAIFIGLLIMVLDLKPPTVAVRLANSLSSLASPLAMIYIGMFTRSLLKKRLSLKGKIGMPLISKLFTFPILIACLLSTFPLPIEVTQIAIVQTTMPCLALAPILFSKYAGDEEYGVAMTVMSTLLSLGTIPIMTMIGLYIVHLNNI